MLMDKKSILALIFIGAILILYPVYLRKVAGVKEPIQRQQPLSEVREAEIPKDEETYAAAPSSDKAVQRKQEPSTRDKDSSVLQSVKPDTIVVDTDIFRGRLSSEGGGTIVSWKLKKHYTGDKEEKKRKEEEKWVELIPDSAVGNLGLRVGVDLSRAVFDVEADTSGETKRYIFKYNLGDGRRVEREYVVVPNSYRVGMSIRLLSFDREDIGEGYTVHWRSGLSPTESNVRDDLSYYQAYAFQGGELLKTKEEQKIQTGDTDWVAVRTKYFLVAIIPEETAGSGARLKGQKVQVVHQGDGTRIDWKRFDVQLEMPFKGQAEETAKFAVYLGPMDYPLLKGLGVHLEKMMNFGMMIIRPFSIAFFYTLQFLYKIVRNYGWAIIIFSVFIKIVLYPLTRKQLRSMKQMQELQPKLTVLKEKHKKDPQKLNKETMKLYKQHGVNPMGGCLPLLLQMPVLFALFNLFRTTIMLRQASFLGIIKDLSAPDGIIQGFNILPILMGVTMILQQKTTTQAPQQKTMAYIMPIFLLFIFYKLSAGLNLYYLMFNVLSITQELIIKRKK